MQSLQHYSNEEQRRMSVITYEVENANYGRVMAHHLTVLQAQIVDRLGTDPDELNQKQLKMIRKSNFSVTEVGTAPISPAGQSFPVVQGMIGTKHTSDKVQKLPPRDTIVPVKSKEQKDKDKAVDKGKAKGKAVGADIRVTALGSELSIKSKILENAKNVN